MDWQDYLAPEEKVLWQGKPTQKLFVYRPIEFFLVPFSVVWCALAVPSASAALLAGIPFFLFGLLFLGATAYVSIGRFLIDRHIRRKTDYLLTDQRAFISKRAFGSRIQELPITKSLAVEFKNAARGSVWLGPRVNFMTNMTAMIGVWHGDDGGFTFREIENPKDVYSLIQGIKAKE